MVHIGVSLGFKWDSLGKKGYDTEIRSCSYWNWEAGSTVAKQCRSAGWEVAIIDSRPLAVPVPYEDVRQRRCWLMLQNLETGSSAWKEGFHTLTWVVGTDAFQRTFTEPVPSKRGMPMPESPCSTGRRVCRSDHCSGG